jgi:NodT family efflux transporter outer membrane factor (OMF) lipoprotein
MKRMKKLLPVCAVLLLAACSSTRVGPDYQRPAVPLPAHFKEAEGWTVAKPADAVARDAWWSVFNDPLLNDLAQRVAISNQNVAASVAAWHQAQALVGQQRASLFPSLNLTATATRNSSATAAVPAQRVRADVGASWEPDLWGRLGRSVTGAEAGAQASAGDLATAKLSAQGELVANYLQLRGADAQRKLLEAAIADYQRVVSITENRYKIGVAPKTDLLQAQTQLSNAQSDFAGLMTQRAQLEHAIAVLLGEPPTNFSIAPMDGWHITSPDVPALLPSELLQRRPDIAAAERRVAAANEQIGIARSAYFPSLTLSAGTGGYGASAAGLLTSPTSVWSLGIALTQPIFNAGLTKYKIAGAQAAYEQEIALYRQTVLSAFQSVEDQLILSRILAEQETLLAASATSATQAAEQVLNRYRAGQVSFLDVVIAQTTALNARRALLQVQANRQVTSVSLIRALGGGWSAVAAAADAKK